MAKCPELFHKFKQYSAACGLGNERDMQNFIDFAEEISRNYKIQEDKVYLLFSITAAKPLFKFDKSSKIRKCVVDKVVDQINKNNRVTKKQVDFWLFNEGVPIKTESVSPAKIAKVVMVDSDIVKASDIKTKRNSLISSLTPGQIQILNDIMAKYNHDDEIGAISLALIWAKERMQNENV